MKSFELLRKQSEVEWIVSLKCQYQPKLIPLIRNKSYIAPTNAIFNRSIKLNLKSSQQTRP